MGWDLMTLKRYDEALETFQRIMREYPESKYENGVLPADHAGYSIAHCLYARGDIDQAMAAFDEAVRKCPDVRAGDNDGNLRSELFLNMLENEDEWKATAKGPDQPADPAEEIYRRAYRSKGDAALKACLRLVTQYPKHKLAGAALANTAWALSALGFYDEAIARYRRILEEYADSQFMSGKPVAPKAAWYIACCYYEKGDMQGARKAFDFALEKYPDANVRGKTYGEIFLTLIEKVDAAVGKPGK
jgi:tetratricopeptide (TPR) repeat protein